MMQRVRYKRSRSQPSGGRNGVLLRTRGGAQEGRELQAPESLQTQSAFVLPMPMASRLELLPGPVTSPPHEAES